MKVTTQQVRQVVLDNVVRFKDLVTSAALVVKTKYKFQPVQSAANEARREASGNDRAPMRFVYRDLTTRALVQVSSFDITSLYCNGKSFEDYFISYPESEVATQVAPEFTVNSIKHQLVDGTYVDEVIDEPDLANPMYKYPLYCYVGYTKYMTKRTKLIAKPGVDKTTFRMDKKYGEICRASGISPDNVGRHFKQLNLDCPFFEVDEQEVEAYKAKLALS